MPGFVQRRPIGLPAVCSVEGFRGDVGARSFIGLRPRGDRAVAATGMLGAHPKVAPDLLGE
jgi:hypothetical protein